MFKLILCVALVVLCSCAGIAFARKYKLRKCFAYDLRNFNERLIGEVSYARTPLTDFFEKHEYGEDFTSLLNQIKQEEFGRVEVEFAYLTDEYRRLVRDYFLMLGKSDFKSQRDYLQSVRAELEREKTNAETEYKRRLALYTKLGFLLGLILAILLI